MVAKDGGVVDVMDMLGGASAGAANVGYVTGAGWQHYYRFPHPSYDVRAGATEPVSWQTVANRRGVVIDVATASWHDASGTRLHHPKIGSPFDLEPESGPTQEVLLSVLSTLMDHRLAATVLIAEWTGYGSVEAGRDLRDSRSLGIRRLSGADFSVWETSDTVALQLITGGDETAEASSNSVLANYVWDAAGDWLVAANYDLASTYCGTIFPIETWSIAEWAQVHPDSPLG